MARRKAVAQNKEPNLIKEITVVKYFIRAVKNRGLYLHFRSQANNSGFSKYIMESRNMNNGTPFSNAVGIRSIAKTINSLNRDFKSRSEDRDYDYITNCINHLLHYFIEPLSNKIRKPKIDMNFLCKFGNEIYNLSCKKLYGDSFKEESVNESIDNSKRRGANIPTLESLNRVYHEGINNGYYTGITFDEFLHTFNHNDIFGTDERIGALSDNPW